MAKQKAEEKRFICVSVGTPKMVKPYYGNKSVIQIQDTERLDVEYSTLDSIIEQVQGFRDKYGSQYSDLCFKKNTDCGCREYNCGCTPKFILTGKREETDLEFNHRIGNEAAQKVAQEKAERATFEKLKKKFKE